MTEEIREEGISEEEIIEESIPSLTREDIGSILNSVKLDVSAIDNFSEEEIKIEEEMDVALDQAIEKVKATSEPVKRGPKKAAKDDSGIVQDLYSEFSSFMEVTAKIKQDSGTKTIIPTGIDILDAIMGGGFAAGTFSVVVGNPGSGKSCLSAQTMGSFQRLFPGNLSAFLDSEEATTTSRLYNLGVRNPKIKPYNDITVEKVFKFLEGLCLFKEQKKLIDKPSFVIWDSIANTLSEKERECDDVNQVIGYKARMLSILVPKYIAKLAQYNITVVAVNQLRDVLQMGPYGAPRDLKFMSSHKSMPGGTVIKFNAFHLLEIKVSGTIEAEKHGFDGFVAKVKCVKNKLFTPNIEIEMCGDFISGFSNFWTNYKFLVDNKRLQSGAWNALISAPEIKFRTKDAETIYKTNPNFKQAFDSAVKECIQTELLDPHTLKEEEII
jgi:RecA/RadA recombinase